MMQPLVTILIPTYKRAGFLRAAISSALAQTHVNLEVIVLDDHSPDETPTVVEEFKADSRLRYMRHTTNLGIAGNWKSGITAARGQFFCLLHDDDTFEPEFVEILLQPLLRDENLILVFCDHWIMNESGQRLPADSDKASHIFKRDALPEGWLERFASTAILDMSIPVGATLFRTHSIDPDFIDERAKGSIDAWLLYQCAKTGHEAFYVSRRLMNYREHSGGMSASMPLYMADGHLFRYKSILADLQMKSLHPAIKERLQKTQAHAALKLAMSGEEDRARSLSRESLRSRWNQRAALALLLTYSGPSIRKATVLLQRLRRSMQNRQV